LKGKVDPHQVFTYDESIYLRQTQATFVVTKGGFMSNGKLIELYGRRFTPSVKLLGFIAILIFGLLIAFNKSHGNEANDINVNIEYLLEDRSKVM
jgi:hypothetical protein